MIAMAFVNAISGRISCVNESSSKPVFADIDSTYEAILNAIFAGFVDENCSVDLDHSTEISTRAQSSLQALLCNVSATLCPMPEDIEKELLARANIKLESVTQPQQQGIAIPQERAD
jgi:hypothetical protein